MVKFLAPLSIFVVGMILLLIGTVFNPAIGNAVSATQAQITPQVTSQFWGLDWAMNSTRLIIFLVGVACILLSVFTFWLKRR